LTVGQRADLVVLTANPLAVEASAILGIDVEATFLDGVIQSPGSVGGPSGRKLTYSTPRAPSSNSRRTSASFSGSE
jgi:hypothetical protein